jgi:hypothetical protein
VSGYPDGGPPREPAGPARPNRKWTAGVVALVVVFAALAGYDLISKGVASGRAAATPPALQAGAHPTAAASTGAATPAAGPSASASASPAASAAAGELTIASAVAYGPDGASDGDHPDLAPGIINGGGQPWHSSWYDTAGFGNLQSGTGLLLDMGQPVSLSRVQLVLGSEVGANVQVRVGDAALSSGLPVAATADDVGGTVQVRLTTPAEGQYVLIWFTQLPPNGQGKYAVSVYSAAVYGTKGTLFVAPG